MHFSQFFFFLLTTNNHGIKNQKQPCFRKLLKTKRTDSFIFSPVVAPITTDPVRPIDAHFPPVHLNNRQLQVLFDVIGRFAVFAAQKSLDESLGNNVHSVTPTHLSIQPFPFSELYYINYTYLCRLIF